MLTRIRNRLPRSLLLPALLFALAFRAMMPLGYMPVAASDGLRIVMCSGFELPATGSDPAPVGSSAHDGTAPCPFAASALPPLPVSAAVFAVSTLAAAPIIAPRADSGIVFTPVRVQQARAPPPARQIES